MSGHQLPVITGRTPLSTLDETSPIFPRSSSKYATTNGALLLAHALTAPPVPSPVQPTPSTAPIAPVGTLRPGWSTQGGSYRVRVANRAIQSKAPVGDLNDLVRRHESKDEGHKCILLPGAPDGVTIPPEALLIGY